MPLQDFGRVADIYDATRSLPEEQMRPLLKQIEKEAGYQGSLVDIGVGTGRFAKPLQEMGMRVAGVDISRGMMAKASEKGVRDLLFADVHRLPFRDKTFDSALMVHILHLVGDWSRVVREAARVSRGPIMSVLGDVDGPSMEEVYLGIRTQMGYPLDRFGGERGIQKRVEPAKLIRVEEAEKELKTDDEIEALLRREKSMTWDLPDDVHRRVIAELRAKYAGKVFKTKQSIELAVWTPDQLQSVHK